MGQHLDKEGVGDLLSAVRKYADSKVDGTVQNLKKIKQKVFTNNFVHKKMCPLNAIPGEVYEWRRMPLRYLSFANDCFVYGTLNGIPNSDNLIFLKVRITKYNTWAYIPKEYSIYLGNKGTRYCGAKLQCVRAIKLDEETFHKKFEFIDDELNNRFNLGTELWDETNFPHNKWSDQISQSFIAIYSLEKPEDNFDKLQFKYIEKINAGNLRLLANPNGKATRPHKFYSRKHIDIIIDDKIAYGQLIISTPLNCDLEIRGYRRFTKSYTDSPDKKHQILHDDYGRVDYYKNYDDKIMYINRWRRKRCYSYLQDYDCHFFFKEYRFNRWDTPYKILRIRYRHRERYWKQPWEYLTIFSDYENNKLTVSEKE